MYHFIIINYKKWELCIRISFLFVRDKYFKNYFRSIVKMQKSLKKSSIPGVPPKMYSNLEWVEVVCWKIFWNYLIPE